MDQSDWDTAGPGGHRGRIDQQPQPAQQQQHLGAVRDKPARKWRYQRSPPHAGIGRLIRGLRPESRVGVGGMVADSGWPGQSAIGAGQPYSPRGPVPQLLVALALAAGLEQGRPCHCVVGPTMNRPVLEQRANPAPPGPAGAGEVKAQDQLAGKDHQAGVQAKQDQGGRGPRPVVGGEWGSTGQPQRAYLSRSCGEGPGRFNGPTK